MSSYNISIIVKWASISVAMLLYIGPLTGSAAMATHTQVAILGNAAPPAGSTGMADIF